MTINKYLIGVVLVLSNASAIQAYAGDSGLSGDELREKYNKMGDEELAREYSKLSSEYIKAVYHRNDAFLTMLECLARESGQLGSFCNEEIKKTHELYDNFVTMGRSIKRVEAEMQQRNGIVIESLINSLISSSPREFDGVSIKSLVRARKSLEFELELYRQEILQKDKEIQALQKNTKRHFGGKDSKHPSRKVGKELVDKSKRGQEEDIRYEA